MGLPFVQLFDGSIVNITQIRVLSHPGSRRPSEENDNEEDIDEEGYVVEEHGFILWVGLPGTAARWAFECREDYDTVKAAIDSYGIL